MPALIDLSRVPYAVAVEICKADTNEPCKFFGLTASAQLVNEELEERAADFKKSINGSKCVCLKENPILRARIEERSKRTFDYCSGPPHFKKQGKR